MAQDFTYNNLILLAYGEIAQDQQSAMLSHTLCDEQLSEKFATILNVKDRLDADMKSPSDTSLQIIMQHSRDTRELETFC